MTKHKQFLRTDNAKKRIMSVDFVRDVDDSPDLSFIGEYGRDAQENSIDRQERNDMDRGEYRYFTPALSGDETGNLDSPEQDYQRMESYNAGQWCMLFCQARAVISINGVQQTITSSGLGGVESDSEESYFGEIQDEQFGELAEILADMGFSKAQIDKAFKSD